MVFLIYLGAFGLLGLVIFIGMRKHNSMLADGKIIERLPNFMEKASVFTLRKVTEDELRAALWNFDLADMHASMEEKPEVQQFYFKGRTWTAVLETEEISEERSVFRFEFLVWKDAGTYGLEMNKLQTAMEKMFKAFDPAVQVRLEKQQIKTEYH